MSQVILHKKDCLAAMAGLEDRSVQLLLTAPPYCMDVLLGKPGTQPLLDNLFATPGWEELDFPNWLSAMGDFFAQAGRVLRREGYLVVLLPFLRMESLLNLGKEQGLVYHGCGIWHDDAGRQEGSSLAWLCLGGPDAPGAELPDFYETNGLTRKERQYGRHPSQLPESLMQLFVSRLSREGDWVLDPFMGSGTTGVAAQGCGRNFIGMELDGGYFAMAKARIRGQTQARPQVIDLFSGAGGLSLGFHQAGFDVVLACENDPDIAQAYQHNHKDTQMLLGDLGTLPLEETFAPYAGKIDVLLAGPPSQGFSRRKPVEPEKAWDFLLGRFLEVLSILEPRYFVLEADPHLSTAEHGFFLKSLRRRCDALGYQVNTAVLNAADFGIPQNRKRTILLGKLGSHAPELPMEAGETITAWDAIGDLAFLQSGEGSEVQDYPQLPASGYARSLRGSCQQLYNHTATHHSPLALERMALIPPEGSREALPEDMLTKTSFSGTWSRMVRQEPAVPINTRFDTPSTGRFTHPYLNRAITVREAARLQSFPDDFIFTGPKGSQMKQVGTALPPKLAQAIAAVIQRDMEDTQ